MSSASGVGIPSFQPPQFSESAGVLSKIEGQVGNINQLFAEVQQILGEMQALQSQKPKSGDFKDKDGKVDQGAFQAAMQQFQSAVGRLNSRIERTYRKLGQAQAMLQRLSLAVDTANSGEEALQRLADSTYDIVLMDEQMPGMDGLEATRVLREREMQGDVGQRRHTVVVALTANADSDSQQRCLEAGMDGFLAKPVRRKALRAMLAGWIANLPVEEE